MSCFDNKRYVLDDGIRTLAYLHKDSVASCKEIQKYCGKKDCDKKYYNKKDEVGSNVNEVISAVLNSLFFFTKRFHTHKKQKDATRQEHKQRKSHKDTTKQKHKNRKKRKTKIRE